MEKCLILLTNYYPFHKGEEYLESEINYLSKKFYKILIISTMVNKNMSQTRNVPENVDVLPIGVDHSVFGKVNMVRSQYKKIYRNKEKMKMIKQDTNGNILHKLYCYYFECRAMYIYSELKDKLRKYNFNNYDSIIIYSYWLYITARVALELKDDYFRERSVHTISRAHRYDLYEDVAPLNYLPEREFLLNGLDAIYPCSNDGVYEINKKYPNFKGKIKVGRLGTVSPGVMSRTKDDKLYIVSCSVVRKVKRLDLLIESLTKLESKNIPYLWTHIGGGPEFKKIKKLAQKKLSRKNVDFKGFLKNQDVLNWYKNNYATVFVNISSSEGVPVAIMEAISMGLPVIATDVGGTREIVENTKNGYLLSKNCNADDIANCLLTFHSIDKGSYIQMCEDAINIWRERCDADYLYDKFSSFLITK
ncbi:glycosyltransferase [Virgibacillus proomii]|uniref:glycosyltransferase n=1 Tax=Virgibacillus proomii TaxID=84407 RepID=UPI0009857808|nr:glycosyltransferase [Virgibacillus proomii]